MSETMIDDASDLCVGAAVTPFVREAGFEVWNRYAAVNDEFVGIHMDDTAGQAAGYPGAFGMGNLLWAWLHCAADRWLGDRGRLVALECRFRKPALKGDRITCSGTVTAVQSQPDGSVLLSLDLWAETQAGDRIAVATGQVRLAATDA